MQSQISDAKNKLRSADDYRQLVGSYFEQTVADVYEHYERELHRMNAMDFDDLLVRSVNLLELFQEVRDRYATAFRWILVDEYQDTNHAQYRWLQLLASEHRNLAVVGDDDQSVYGFRGADITEHPQLSGRLPDAHVVKLEQNYRSTQTILSAANAVVANNRGRMAKALWTEIGEGDPSRCGSSPTSTRRRGSSRRRSSGWSTRASRARRSRSSTGPTRSRGCSRTCWCARRSATRSSAARSSTSGRRSATRSPT